MDIAAFNWVDFTILGVVGFSTLISFARGFVREAISLATWVLAIWIAYKYGQSFGQSVLTMVTSDQARAWIGSAVLFFAVLIAGALVNFAIGHFIFFTGLSAIDRILGMAFGFARGILLVAVLMLVGQLTQSDKNLWWTQSQLIPQFSALSEWLKGFVPEQFEKLKQKEAVHQPKASPAAVPAQSGLGAVLPQAVDVAKQNMEGVITQLVPTENAPPVPVAPIPSPGVAATPAAPSTTTTTTTTIQAPAPKSNTPTSTPAAPQTYY